MALYSFPVGVTPKRGCYLLLKIYKNPPEWKPEIEEWIADAFYKESMDSPYSKSFERIRLKPLFNRDSSQFEKANYDNCSKMLLNTVIQIDKIQLVDVVGQGYSTFVVEWKPVCEYEERELIAMFPYYYKLYPTVKTDLDISGTLSPEDDIF